MTTMTDYKFTAEFARQTRVPNAVHFFTEAATPLRERAYGSIRVQTNWTPLASDEDIVQIDVLVRGDLTAIDAPAYVELFFHDAFLLFNLALPGSFGGAITLTGGDFRANDLSFDAAPFACGADAMPLAEVIAWYPAETNQIASTPMQATLFHLLHIARSTPDEWTQRAHLTECQTALGINAPIDAIPLTHPMHDESLDDRIDDAATDILDRAMVRVLTAMQNAARERCQ
jgi:hypothetical protein